MAWDGGVGNMVDMKSDDLICFPLLREISL